MATDKRDQFAASSRSLAMPVHARRTRLGNAPYILWLIRERHATTLTELWEHFFLDDLGRQTRCQALNDLRHIIASLEQAGLIAADECDLPEKYAPPRQHFVHRDIKLHATPLVQQIQAALNISLVELSQRQSTSLSVVPLFGKPASNLEIGNPDIFVLMPFAANLKPVYDDHLKSVEGHGTQDC